MRLELESRDTSSRLKENPTPRQTGGEVGRAIVGPLVLLKRSEFSGNVGKRAFEKTHSSHSNAANWTRPYCASVSSISFSICATASGGRFAPASLRFNSGSRFDLKSFHLASDCFAVALDSR